MTQASRLEGDLRKIFESVVESFLIENEAEIERRFQAEFTRRVSTEPVDSDTVALRIDMNGIVH